MLLLQTYCAGALGGGGWGEEMNVRMESSWAKREREHMRG